MRLFGRRDRSAVEVVVYTRQACGLCRRAEDIVAQEARHESIRHVDVDSDPDLQARYNVRVPVVAVDGDEVAEGFVDPEAVTAAIRDARRRRKAQG